ncbi:MAG: flagellar FlbD family protein [Myxococcales bacterium]|nr:flagellar FlbD family protein [Myxococcales bacterium]
MIFLTRLDGREVVVNSDLIVTVESTPDTMVTLTTGDRLLVRESVDGVVERAVAFRYRTLQGPGTSRQADGARTERTRLPTAPPVPGGQVSDGSSDAKPSSPPSAHGVSGAGGNQANS